MTWNAKHRGSGQTRWSAPNRGRLDHVDQRGARALVGACLIKALSCGAPLRRVDAQGRGVRRLQDPAAVCAVTGLPLAWRVETARRNESLYAAPLLDAVTARGYRPETVAMDRGYDNNRVYDECHARGVAPVIPLRKGRNQPDYRSSAGTEKWGDLYRRRTSVEREFGRLKHNYGLVFLRVRGIERVRLHADLIMLARLS